MQTKEFLQSVWSDQGYYCICGKDQKNIVKNKKPEKLGCALVPNYDAVKNISIDSLVKSFNYDEEKRVLLISHILSESVKINNE